MNRTFQAFLLAVALAAGGGPAARADQPTPARIDKNGLLVLLRTTLSAVQQANETGNYTVLRDLSAPGFQKANSAARLGEIFAGLRSRDFDLSGVQVLEPRLTVLPQIEANGMMRVAGFFPSAPMQVNFEVLYAPVDGRWRPFGISVGVGSSNPAPAVVEQAAPPPLPQAQPQAQQARPERKKQVVKQPVPPHATLETPSATGIRAKAAALRSDVAAGAPTDRQPAPPANLTPTGLY